MKDRSNITQGPDLTPMQDYQGIVGGDFIDQVGRPEN